MKLPYTPKRTILAGFVALLSLGVAMDAWAQQLPSDCRVSGRARLDALPGTIERILDNPNARTEDLDQALADCRNMGQLSVSGRICVARINLTRARQSEEGRRDRYVAARLEACRASGLARNSATYRGQADGYWAEALVGLLNMGAGDPTVYERELNTVHGEQAAAVVHRAVAERHLSRNDVASARSEADRHLRNSPREYALTLTTIAAHQRRSGAGDAAVRQTLEQAYQADRTSLAVNSALGHEYFQMGRNYWSTAEPYLRAAIQITPPPAGDDDAQELAFYHLSVIEADRGNLSRALEYADDAGNEAHAQRQVCLVRLMIGRDQVYNATRNSQGRIIEMRPSEDARRSCERLGSSAEGQLLEGMFWLRYSQFRGEAFAPVIGSVPDNYTPWHDAISIAERAFENGRRRLGDDTTTKVDWPGTDVSLRAMLGYGDDLADYFLGFCRGSINSTDDELRAEEIFVDYKIVRERGDQRRCLPPN